MKSFWLITILLTAGLLSSCTDKQETTTDDVVVSEDVSDAVEDVAYVEADTVVIHSMQFQPQNVLAHKGQKLVWVNKGIVGHNVTENPDRTWTSGDFEVGETWEMTVDESFEYLCTLHPTMIGSVKVVD